MHAIAEENGDTVEEILSQIHKSATQGPQETHELLAAALQNGGDVPPSHPSQNGKVMRSLFVRPDASIWAIGGISEEFNWKEDFNFPPIEVENAGARPAVLAFYETDEQLFLLPKEVRRVEPGARDIIQFEEPLESFKVVIKVPKIDQAHPWDEEELTIVEMCRGSAYSIEVAIPQISELEIQGDLSLDNGSDASPLHGLMHGLQQVLSPQNDQDHYYQDHGEQERVGHGPPPADPSKRKVREMSPISPRSLCSIDQRSPSSMEIEPGSDSMESIESFESQTVGGACSSSKCEKGFDVRELGLLHVDEVSMPGTKACPLVWRANLGEMMPEEVQVRLRDGHSVSVQTQRLQGGKCLEVASHFDSALQAQIFQSSELRPRPILDRQLVLVRVSFFLGVLLTLALTCVADLVPIFVGLNVLGASLLLVWGGILPWLRDLLVKCVCYGLQWQGDGLSWTLEVKSVRKRIPSHPEDASNAKSRREIHAANNMSVVDFSGRWELEVERSDDPAGHLEALGASWVQQQLARQFKRTIVIRQRGLAWSETMSCSVVSKTSKLVLDGSEQREVNPFDGSCVTMHSTIQEDGRCVMTERVYGKTGIVQHTARRLLDSGRTYSISHDLCLACGKVLKSTFYYKKVVQACEDE